METECEQGKEEWLVKIKKWHMLIRNGCGRVGNNYDQNRIIHIWKKLYIHMKNIDREWLMEEYVDINEAKVWSFIKNVIFPNVLMVTKKKKKAQTNNTNRKIASAVT